MILRREYLDKLLSWKDEKVIKVVTGVRRSGKSTLLAQFRTLLSESGVDESRIISVNFEELENEELLDYRKLYSYLKEKIDPDRMNYIFLDEVQNVDSYEKVVDSLFVKDYADIYITGSNSYMLSGDLATMLTGRYVEVKMLPFSFREFSEAKGGVSDGAFSDYLRVGGMPYVVTSDRTAEMSETYLEGIYNTVIVKDIEERQSRKEAGPTKRKVSDIPLLKSIAKFLAGSVGSIVSVKSIADYLVSSGRKVSANTVADYVDALCESFIFYEAERFDVTGKALLKSGRKYYIVDLGLRNYILPRRGYDLGFSVENVVFFELMRRGFRVNVGKVGSTEVDFVAQRNGELSYFQVAADITAKETFEREMRPWSLIQDNYPKTILTLDRFTPGNYDGIKVVNLVDWLSVGEE